MRCLFSLNINLYKYSNCFREIAIRFFLIYVFPVLLLQLAVHI
jgi:hypothetical protein